MAPIELASGRKVYLERIDIENIYSGILEGTPERVAQWRRRSLLKTIKQRFWDTPAILVIDDEAPTLPHYRCIAHVQSTPMQADNYYSFLIVCWFVDALDENLYNLARQTLDTINWEASARDVHADDL